MSPYSEGDKSAISAGAAAVSLVAGGSSSDSSAVTKTISAAGLAASDAASSTGGAGKGAPSKSSIAAGGSAVGAGTSGSSAFAAAQAYSKGTAFAGGAMATGGAAAAQSGGWAAALGPFLAMGGAALGFYLVGTGPAGRGEDELVRKLGLGTGSGVAVNANEKTPDQKPIVAAGEKAEGAAAGAAVQEGGKSDIKRPLDVPENWEERPANKGGGIKWVNPENPLHDYVRGKADDTYTQVRDGKAYDAAGNKVDLASPAAHGITLSDFVFRPGKNK